MSNNRIIEEFIELAKIDSESFSERNMADALTKRLSDLGLKVREDAAKDFIGGNAGNLYALWEGDPETAPILFSAHMDTVRPGNGKKPELADGIIKSDGSTVLGADDLAGVTEILEGIRRVKESGKNHRTVEVLFTVAEEAYTKGASVFDYSRILSKQAYCLDLSGDVGQAVYKAPTLISFRVRVKGRASHAGFAAAEGISAIKAVSVAISKLQLGQVDEESTRNIGIISGGCATNIVPEECTSEGEIRSLGHERALELLKETEDAFAAAGRAEGAEVEFEYTVHLKAYEVNKESPVVARFQKVSEELGLPGKLISTYGGADNHVFCENGLEGIVLSCGMENVHSTEEYIKTENLERGAELVKALILEE